MGGPMRVHHVAKALSLVVTTAVFTTAIVATVACTPDSAPVRIALTMGEVEETPPRYGAVPFPSDAYLNETGRIGVIPGLEDAIPLEHALVNANLSRTDGFGLRPTVRFFFTNEIDPLTLDDARIRDALVVVNVDPRSARVGERVPMEWRVDDDGRAIAGAPEPGFVLDEGARHAAIALTTVFARSPATERMLTSTENEMPARWRSTVRALPEVRRALDEDGERAIAALTVFTTAHATREVVSARETLTRAPLPALAFDDDGLIFTGPATDAVFGVAAREESGEHQGSERWGWANPSGIAHESVHAIATGTMTAPSFIDGDIMAFDDGGAPRIVRDDTFAITFVVPKGTPPASGWPVAVVGHGLGAGRHQVLAFAEPLCSAGFALVAIDMHGHGSRFVDVDTKNNTAMIVPAFDGDALARDGFGDVTGTGSVFQLLHEMKNLTATRDSVRQSALDLSSVTRLLSAGVDLSLVVGGDARLDGARIAYLGESYGAVVGTVFAAIEPLVDMFIFDVPGGGVLDLAITGSPDMRPMIDLFVRSVYGVEGKLDRFHPLIALGQAVLDGADPLSFAPHIQRDRFIVDGAENAPRHVLGIVVLGDEVMPNRSTDAWAKALGLPRLLPRLTTTIVDEVSGPVRANADGQTAVLVEYAPATHGANWVSDRGVRKFAPYDADDDTFERLLNSIEIENPMRATMAQVTHALTTWKETGAPTVISTAPPRADFDDDGVEDTVDEAPHAR
jgi:pimeloyl-ACP methyl ester carboxylesterase